MIYFSELFSQTKDDYIIYQGKKVYSIDRYKLNGNHKVKFAFVSNKSPHEQCIVLSLYGVNCDIYLDGKKYKQPKNKFPTLDLFEKYYGKEIILEINLIDGEIGLCNGAIRKIGENEIVTYCSYGCAMQIEEISSTKKRYYCNDYENDDDFDDLVFEMEIID
ncbi:MAG: hypothetical protein ACM3O4_01350 [Ignavibacteriales bacterium]